MLTAYLKQNREHPVLKPLFALRTGLRKIANEAGPERVAYWLQEHVCEVASKFSPVEDVDDMRANFERHHVLVVKNGLSDAVVQKLRNSMVENLDRGNIFRNEMLIKDQPTFLQKFKDKYLGNVILFYNYPTNHLNEISLVVNPLKNIEGLKEEIERNLLPKINVLMGSPAEVVRAWAYRTNNFGGKETRNHNGRMHLDGDRHASLKCLVYLNDVNETNGPFCYRDPVTGEEVNVFGPAGTVLFFKSSLLWHRATNTVESERLCFSFLCHPALRNSFPDSEYLPNYVMKTLPFLPTSAHIRVK